MFRQAMLTTNSLMVCSLLIVVNTVSILSSTWSIKFDRLDGMSRGRSVPIRSMLVINKQKGKTVYITIVNNVTEDILGDPWMYITMNRCHSKENLDTCEEFLKANPVNFCNTIDVAGGKYNPLYVDFKPKFSCPIKKGSYTATNTTLDLAPMMMFPMGSWYWKTLIEVRDLKTQKLLLCIHSWAHLVKRH